MTDQKKDFDSDEDFLLCQITHRGDSSSDSDDIPLAKYKELKTNDKKKKAKALTEYEKSFNITKIKSPAMPQENIEEPNDTNKGMELKTVQENTQDNTETSEETTGEIIVIVNAQVDSTEKRETEDIDTVKKDTKDEMSTENTKHKVMEAKDIQDDTVPMETTTDNMELSKSLQDNLLSLVDTQINIKPLEDKQSKNTLIEAMEGNSIIASEQNNRVGVEDKTENKVIANDMQSLLVTDIKQREEYVKENPIFAEVTHLEKTQNIKVMIERSQEQTVVREDIHMITNAVAAVPTKATEPHELSSTDTNNNTTDVTQSIDENPHVDTSDTVLAVDNAVSTESLNTSLTVDQIDQILSVLGDIPCNEVIVQLTSITVGNNESQPVVENQQSGRYPAKGLEESRTQYDNNSNQSEDSQDEYVPPDRGKRKRYSSDYSSDSTSRSRERKRKRKFKRRKTCVEENEKNPVEDDTNSLNESSAGVPDSVKSRRKQRNPSAWKRHRTKQLRNSGKAYTNNKGNAIPAKTPKNITCKCKYSCSDKITENKMSEIFQSYWDLSYDRQRDFIRCNAIMSEKRRKTKDPEEESRRKHTIHYYLPVDECKVEVCKKTFLGTLDIGEKTVSYTLKKKKNPFTSTDKRGKHVPRNTISEDEKNFIRKHIRSFPKTESHYCRKSTQREYLDSTLSIRKMYTLYIEKCKKDHREAQKFWLYDKIFATEFNLGFHKPKKDKCAFCDAFANMSDFEKQENSHKFEKHQQRKQEARMKKQEDKQRSMENERIKTLNFDLQKVLVTPKAQVNDLYYSRKLATYNFTIFDITTKETVCNMWWETIAKRGSCEIASCLLDYNKNIGSIDELVYYSDSCTGQQRNLPFSGMCLYSVVNHPIKKITHNYFERGHSQMEGDSVHATIERSTRHSDMFSPSDWMVGVRNAKVNPPRYVVRELENKDVLDFKEFTDNCVSNRNRAEDGTKVKWNDIHSFQYRKEEPTKIFFKYEISQPEYNSIDIQSGRNRGAKLKSIKNYHLKQLYSSLVPISDAKYKDLMTLCKKNVIPHIHHRFYSDLPHKGSVSNTLEEPDENDLSE